MSPNKRVSQRIVPLIKTIIEHKFFNNFIISLILINAVVLGLETSSYMRVNYGFFLKKIDTIILWIFLLEILFRLSIYKISFFKDPWAVFDLTIILITFIPSNNAFSVIRTLRILRVLRLISAFPALKRVVQGLITSIPGISAIGAILVIITYIFAVMATNLYGEIYPKWFGSLEASCFSLFQIMTLEGWPDIVRTVMKTHGYAWIFFITFILIATFSTLNLFIAVIVDGMQKQNTVNSTRHA